MMEFNSSVANSYHRADLDHTCPVVYTFT
jgi:hypothetical protein